MKASLTIIISTLFVLVVGLPVTVHAKSKGAVSEAPYRMVLHGGLSYQDFIGAFGADFDSIRQSYFAFSAQKNWALWNVGFQYFSVSAANLKSFQFADNTQGQYRVPFNRYQLLGGLALGAWHLHAILGLESSTWSGSPELGVKEKFFLHTGLQVAYDVSVTPSIKIPLVFAIVHHPEREYEFENYPNAKIQVAQGTEISLGTGIAFGF